jgi:GNAT superfamily N-acetyltransferase
MGVTIRRATVLDHSRILELLIKWLEESLIKGLPGCCMYSGIWLADLIAKHLVLIACRDDKLLGSICLKKGYLPWNNEMPLLFNEFLMTEEEGRELGVADRLLAASKEFAKQEGSILMMGHFSGKAAELKDRYLRIKGFKYGGGTFFYLRGDNGWN